MVCDFPKNSLKFNCMKVFEFHFNPKLKPDLIFDSFCYEPENIYEKRLGSLYLVGLLKNALPQNFRFLENLAKIIKERYYRLTLKNPEKALKESLKEANEFLEQIAKKGDVSWLGNLSFTALSLTPHQKPWWEIELNFTKVGEIKIFLLRAGKIIDIDKKLKFQDIEPYPLKIFGNIVSGKLVENDIILVLTKEVLDFFESQNLLSEISKITPFDEKKLNEIFNKKGGELSNVSGICLLILLTKEISAGKRLQPAFPPPKRHLILPRLQPKKFSFKEVFAPLIKAFKNLFLNFCRKLKSIKWFPLKVEGVMIKRVGRPKLKLPKLSLASKKNLILILALIFLLTLGFFISQKEKEKELKETEIFLNKIEEKLSKAEGFLILKETNLESLKQANSLLKEAWEEILPLTKKETPLKDRVFSLRNSIESQLFDLNKLEIISEPELIFDFSQKEFFPVRLIYFKGNLYFFNPFSQNLFKINTKGEGQILEVNQKFNLGAPLENSVSFFSKPNKISILKEDNVGQPFILKEPYSDFDFNDFASYKENLYFLDSNKGEIIKYPSPLETGKDSPKLWLNPKTKKVNNARSFSMDGSIWILNKQNTIDQYLAGVYQKTLTLDFFPYPKNLTKIFASPTLPYLYLLEPAERRIIILNKTGQVFKQFRSEKFDNLLDFATSDDGKTIYLLSGQKVFKLKL